MDYWFWCCLVLYSIENSGRDTFLTLWLHFQKEYLFFENRGVNAKFSLDSYRGDFFAILFNFVAI